jgi:hypothetical protein
MDGLVLSFGAVVSCVYHWSYLVPPSSGVCAIPLIASLAPIHLAWILPPARVLTSLQSEICEGSVMDVGALDFLLVLGLGVLD